MAAELEVAVIKDAAKKARTADLRWHFESFQDIIHPIIPKPT
jgi:hypothetical protein